MKNTIHIFVGHYTITRHLSAAYVNQSKKKLKTFIPKQPEDAGFWQSIFCKKALSRASDSQPYRERGTVFSCEKDEAKNSIFRLFGYMYIPPLELLNSIPHIQIS